MAGAELYSRNCMWAGRRSFRILPAALAVLLALGGCKSVEGMQEPVKDADLHKSICPSETDIDRFEGLSGTARGAFRNKIVLDCVKAIGAKYFAFKTALHKEAVASNLVTDVLGIGLTAGAALTHGDSAKSFSQSALAVMGIGAAINKDVFYQQTLPAIESSMDETRDKILKSIIDSEKKDPEGKNYTLENAGFDVDSYEGAGNIYAAISQLVTTANKAAQVAREQRVASQQGLTYHIVDVPDATMTRLTKLSDFVWSLTGPKDQKTLDSIASALKVTVIPGEEFVDEQGRVVNAIDATVNSGDPAAQMDAVEKSLTGLYKP